MAKSLMAISRGFKTPAIYFRDLVLEPRFETVTCNSLGNPFLRPTTLIPRSLASSGFNINRMSLSVISVERPT